MGVTANARSIITLYTHFIRAEGWRETRAFFDSVPVFVRPLVIGLFRRNIRAAPRLQGTLRHSDNEIMAFGFADWAAILGSMSEGPYFIGEYPSSFDATLFGALATTVFTSVPDPRLSAHTAQLHGVRRAYDGKILS